MAEKPWRVLDLAESGEVQTFAKLTDALVWIEASKVDRDPEEQSFLQVTYEAPEGWFENVGDYALVMERIVCKIVDGWAGGQANYRLQVAGQWGRPSSTLGASTIPTEFWMPEGDLVIPFSKDDL